ncbi:MAG: glycine cleavage system aminomethyltransferase GcvT [Alphaproteobacteria bacterium]|nr:glycine cleavage system aminomethyltransferase GcvT [Alphaproteobacteria bacterium]
MKHTILHDLHVRQGAKMGPFAGYDMPLFYSEGVIAEHLWTRSHGGVFDVSHMGQILVEGEGAAAFFERITPSAFKPKATGKAQYTVLLNEQGGIIDDLIVTRLAENLFHAVLNAGRKDVDLVWIKQHLPSDLSLYVLDNRSLIAIQGAWAERVMYEIFEYDAHKQGYMTMVESRAPTGEKIYISRTGYTGEDGFEVSLPNDIVPEIWAKLSSHSELKNVGLAARDSLRLEMGYPLYGQDLDETISPVEAGLEWIIRKSDKDFIGAERIVAELANGVSRVRVGVRLTDPGVARAGAVLFDAQDQEIGKLTSGGHSPVLKQSIGMGYVKPAAAVPGTKVFVDVRGKKLAAEIATMPFVPPKTKAVKK